MTDCLAEAALTLLAAQSAACNAADCLAEAALLRLSLVLRLLWCGLLHGLRHRLLRHSLLCRLLDRLDRLDRLLWNRLLHLWLLHLWLLHRRLLRLLRLGCLLRLR